MPFPIFANTYFLTYYPIQRHDKIILNNNALRLNKIDKNDQEDNLENVECIGVAKSSSATIPAKRIVKSDDAEVVIVDALKATDIHQHDQVDRKNNFKTSSSCSDSKSKETTSPSSIFKNHKKILVKESWEDVSSTTRLEEVSFEKELYHSKDSILFQHTQSIAKKRKSMALFQKIPAFLLLFSFILASTSPCEAFVFKKGHVGSSSKEAKMERSVSSSSFPSKSVSF